MSLDTMRGSRSSRKARRFSKHRQGSAGVNLRYRLRVRLRKGCWFPAFQKCISALHDYVCLGSYFNRWLKDADEEKGPAGASELVILGSVVIAIVWLTFITIHVPWLASSCVRTLGAGLAFWRISEIGLVAAHNVFVFSGRIYNMRRSLACFLVNLIEVGLYSTVIIILAGCAPAELSRWELAYKTLSDVFQLRPLHVSGGSLCSLYAHYELTIAGLLVAVVITNLVGRISHDEVERPAKSD